MCTSPRIVDPLGLFKANPQLVDPLNARKLPGADPLGLTKEVQKEAEDEKNRKRAAAAASAPQSNPVALYNNG